MKQQIVFLAPMQLREYVTLGNIYSTLVADMYNKALKILGVTSYFPLVINVNGKKTEDLLKNKNLNLFSSQETEKIINLLINQIQRKYELYDICFDSLIRDDHVYFGNFLDYSFNYMIKNISVKKCNSCNMNFGTDLSILKCKECGKLLVESNEARFFVEVDNKLILSYLEQILFFPNSKKEKLREIIKSFPEKCVFCLEKERILTLNYQNHPLDPKFVAIQSLVTTYIMSKFINPEINFFQGDVLKKFTYYSIAYLEKQFLPKRVISHGLILGIDGKKLRAGDLSDDYLNLLSPKLLRGFLLSFQIGSDIKFSKSSYDSRAVGLIRIINKIKIMLDYETNNDNSPNLFLKEEFLNSILNFDYARAYQYFILLIDKYWSVTRSIKSLQENDKDWIKKVSQLYFGLL